MPIQRLERTRASLPEGYQFGDGRLPAMLLNYDRFALLRAHGIDPHDSTSAYRMYCLSKNAHEQVVAQAVASRERH